MNERGQKIKHEYPKLWELHTQNPIIRMFNNQFIGWQIDEKQWLSGMVEALHKQYTLLDEKHRHFMEVMDGSPTRGNVSGGGDKIELSAKRKRTIDG